MDTGLWERTTYMGEPLTFLLFGPDGDALRASDYLLSLRETLSSITTVSAAAAVYRPLLVYVSLLEDPDATPSADRIDDDAVPDEWFPLHLAVVMRDAAAAAALVEFHQQYAAAVMEDAAAREELSMGGEDTARSTGGSCGGRNGDGKSPSPARSAAATRRLLIETRPELSGAVVLLSNGNGNGNGNGSSGSGLDDNNSAADEAREDSDVISCVATALRPLLVALLRERAAGDAEGCATTAVRAHIAQRVAAGPPRAAGLLIEGDALFNVCGGDLSTLTALLQCFDGILVPVLRGRRMPVMWANSHSSSTNTTPWETPHMRPCSSGMATGSALGHSHSHRLHHATAQLAPFILACAPQELQRLAFFALWIAHRESAAHERPQAGGVARQSREAEVLSDFRVSLHNLKKSCHVIPERFVWSGQLFILSRLVARDCELEAFLDIVEEGDYVFYVSSIPASFVTMAVAGAVVAAFPLNWRLVHLLRTKVETLLVSVPGVLSPLRQYIASRPTNDAERFKELWIAETPLASSRKFNSRAEMLCFATVEAVLLGLEKAWQQGNDDDDDLCRAKAQHVLQEWLNMCHKFFVSLRDRPPELSPPMSRRRSTSRAVHSDASTSESITHKHQQQQQQQRNQVEDSDTYDTEVLRRVCAAIPVRLRQGAAPCPAICDALFSNSKSVELEGGEAGQSIAKANLDEDFETAQVAFGLIAGQKSNEVKLKFYGLYKQALVGDVNTARPWVMDPTGRAKWDAWNRNKGMDKEEAKQLYVSEFRSLHQQCSEIH